MKVTIEASPGELQAKREQAVEQFAERLGVRLEKAQAEVQDTKELEYPVVQALVEKSREIYKSALSAMFAEINGVLDEQPSPRDLRRKAIEIQRKS